MPISSPVRWSFPAYPLAKLFFYVTGTTTKQDTYTTSARSVANANPVRSDATGLFPNIYLTPGLAYKCVMAPSTDTDPPASPIFTVDPFNFESTVPTTVIAVSGDYTVSVLNGDDQLLLCDTTAASLTVSPYTAVGNSGRKITILKIDSTVHTVTFDPSGSQTAGGASTWTLRGQNQWVTFTSDGSNWQVTNRSYLDLNTLMSLLTGLVGDPALCTPKAVDGSYITNVANVGYTCPASTIAIVARVTTFNADTVENDAQVNIVESGGSVAVGNAMTRATQASGETVIYEGPWFLEAGDFISAVSASATGTDMGWRIDVVELPAQLVGVTLIFDDGRALTNAFAAYLTAAAGYKTWLWAITSCNTDTSDHTLSVAIVESGGSVANSKQIIGGSLVTKTSTIIGGPFIVEAGDTVQAKADTGAVVSLRLTAFKIPL